MNAIVPLLLASLFATFQPTLLSTQVLQSGSEPESKSTIELVVGTHRQMRFDKEVTRVAVGRQDVLSIEILNSRELLLLGSSPGFSSALVWTGDASPMALAVSVQPDLSLLRDALEEIHPDIRVEIAPDRPMVVLRGTVPDYGVRQAAEAAAKAYLRANIGGGGAAPLVQDDGSQPGPEGGSGSNVRGTAETGLAESVVNLIRLEKLPPRVDERMISALKPLTDGSVLVRRVMAGDIPDDARDLFVLEGTVPDQVTLSRALFLASRTLLGDAGANGDDLRVLTDEAGGLTQVRQVYGAGVGPGGNVQGIPLLGDVVAGGGGGGGGLQLSNRIGSNLGRAKLVEAAGGRLLSMIEVKNLPLVRVDVRLYEVDLNRLREWKAELGVALGDFTQGALEPAGLAELLQGSNARAVGPDDIQGVLGFLGGNLAGQNQFVRGGLAVDQVFRLLSTQEIARTLSRPSLTVLSGEQALFQVGGEIPVPVAVSVGGGTDQVLSGVEFKRFGIQLTVRPLVEESNGELLTLDVAPVVSFPDLALTAAVGLATGSGTQTTAFEQRATRTHTRLRDGDAMLVGGLVTARDQLALTKVPGLGDVPGLGWLFRDENEAHQETELVLVVHPVILRTPRPDARQWEFISVDEVLSSCLEETQGKR